MPMKVEKSQAVIIKRDGKQIKCPVMFEIELNGSVSISIPLKNKAKHLSDAVELRLEVHPSQVFGKTGMDAINNEREKFRDAILKANGDREKAAKLLGLSRTTFFRRLKNLGLVHTARGRRGMALAWAFEELK